MKEKELVIYIVPKGILLNDLEDYVKEDVGVNKSSNIEIKVNIVTDGYSIIFDDDVFDYVSSSILSRNIISLFDNNIHDTKLTIGVSYMYKLENEDDQEELFDVDVLKNIIDLVYELEEKSKTSKKNEIVYENTGDFERMLMDLKEEMTDEDDDDFDESDLPSESDIVNTGSIINQFLGTINDIEEDEDEDDDKPKKKKKKNKKKYDKSKALTSSKDPKKSYNRHGVIVVKDKDIVEHDAKIIKEFLKSFIPGSGWRKDFRNDILKRWIESYVITSKQLKKLERKHKRKIRKKKINRHFNKNRSMEVVRRVLTEPVDKWYDPNK